MNASQAHRFAHSLSLAAGWRNDLSGDSLLQSRLAGGWEPLPSQELSLGVELGVLSPLSESRSFETMLSIRYLFYLEQRLALFPELLWENEVDFRRNQWFLVGTGFSMELEFFEWVAVARVGIHERQNLRKLSLSQRVALPLSADVSGRDLLGLEMSFEQYLPQTSYSQSEFALFLKRRF